MDPWLQFKNPEDTKAYSNLLVEELSHNKPLRNMCIMSFLVLETIMNIFLVISYDSWDSKSDRIVKLTWTSIASAVPAILILIDKTEWKWCFRGICDEIPKFMLVEMGTVAVFYMKWELIDDYLPDELPQRYLLECLTFIGNSLMFQIFFRNWVFPLLLIISMIIHLICRMLPSISHSYEVIRVILVVFYVIMFSYLIEKRRRALYMQGAQKVETLAKSRAKMQGRMLNLLFDAVAFLDVKTGSTKLSNVAFEKLIGDFGAKDVLELFEKVEAVSPISDEKMNKETNAIRFPRDFEENDLLLSFRNKLNNNTPPHNGSLGSINLNFPKDANDSLRSPPKIGQAEAPDDRSNFILYELRFNNSSKIFELRVQQAIFEESDGLIMIFHDRSLSSKHESEESYKTHLLASVSHEMRTPLSSNMNFIKAALCHPDVPENIKCTLLSPAQTTATLLLHYVNDILDFIQYKTQKLRLVYQNQNLRETIENCIVLVEFQASKKGIKLQKNLHQCPENFSTDHNRVTQILINLLTNAIKFTTKGYVRLEAHILDENVYIAVEDTGLGIKEEDKHKLFTAFSKIDIGSKIVDNSMGAGLGLTIANNLARELGPSHEAGIKVESVYEGGSKFWFLLENKNSALVESVGETHATRPLKSNETSRSTLYFTPGTKPTPKPSKPSMFAHYNAKILSLNQENQSTGVINLEVNREEEFEFESSSPAMLFNFDQTIKQSPFMKFNESKSNSPTTLRKERSADAILRDAKFKELEMKAKEKELEKTLEKTLQKEIIPTSRKKTLKQSKKLIDVAKIRFNLSQLEKVNRTVSEEQLSSVTPDQNHASHETEQYSFRNNPSETCTCPEILIIDDDAFISTSYEAILEVICKKLGKNYKVAYANSGKEALNLIEKRLTNSCCKLCKFFKVVLIDYNMPVMDGRQAAKEIRTRITLHNPKLEDVKICCCSAELIHNETVNDKNLFDFIMLKPIDIQKLEQVIENTLD